MYALHIMYVRRTFALPCNAVTLYVQHTIDITNIYMPPIYILFSVIIYIWIHYYMYGVCFTMYLCMIICNFICSTHIYIYNILHYYICSVLHIVYLYMYVICFAMCCPIIIGNITCSINNTYLKCISPSYI